MKILSLILFIGFFSTAWAQQQQKESHDKRIRFALGIGSSFGSTIVGDLAAFDNDGNGTGTYSGQSSGYTIKTKSAPHLDFDIRYTPTNSWGIMLGASYTLKKKIREMGSFFIEFKSLEMMG